MGSSVGMLKMSSAIKPRPKNPKIDFDVELAKYDAKATEKAEKRAKAKANKETKEAQKKAKADAKLQAKLAKLTPEQLEARNAKIAQKQAREDAHWLKESEKGQKYYEKIQKELNAIQ